jgi:hypothetical protein
MCPAVVQQPSGGIPWLSRDRSNFSRSLCCYFQTGLPRSTWFGLVSAPPATPAAPPAGRQKVSPALGRVAELALNRRVYQAGGKRAMVITTIEVRKTLATLARLISMLEQRSGILDDDQLRLLEHLRQRRHSLGSLLEAREAERAKPVIDLGVWRDGALVPDAFEPQLEISAL